MNYIKVSDKNGKHNNWEIEYDMGDYYEVFYKEFTTILRKDKCFIFEGEMMSSEIRNFCKDDGSRKALGSEECSACGKEVKNLNRLSMLKNTDKYVCMKCAKLLKTRTKDIGV